MHAGRVHLVGDAAALRQPGRLHGAGALLLFSGGAEACVAPNAEVLAALGVYGGVYTCIGVAHAMQGPRRKWRPRIVLLTVLFGVAAAAHIAALPVVALLGLVLMLWVAEGHRSQALPVVLWPAGALVLLFVCYGFSPDAFSYVFRSAAGFLWFSLDPARRFFSTLGNAGITVAACAALAFTWVEAVALLWQYSSAALRSGFDGAGHDRRAGQPMAVGAAVSAHVCGRRVCGCVRGPRGRLALAAAGRSWCCRRCFVC